MSRMKKLLAVILAIVMMVPSTAFAATKSPTKTDLTPFFGGTFSFTTTYNGKNTVTITITYTVNGKTYTLVEGKDFVVVGKKPIKAGKYTIAIKGTGNYTGNATVNYTIKKASKPVVTLSSSTQKALKKGLKAKQLKKKSAKIKLTTKAGGGARKTYTVVGAKAKKYITVSKKGVVKVKKGTPKGTYKIRVKFSRSTNYASGYKTYKIVVK